MLKYINVWKEHFETVLVQHAATTPEQQPHHRNDNVHNEDNIDSEDVCIPDLDDDIILN